MDDCSTVPICVPYQGVHQWFDGSVDLVGYSVVFTPDSVAPDGYTYASTAGLVDYPVTPGSGDATMELPLGNDDSAEVLLSEFSTDVLSHWRPQPPVVPEPWTVFAPGWTVAGQSEGTTALCTTRPDTASPSNVGRF